MEKFKETLIDELVKSRKGRMIVIPEKVPLLAG
jgi:hypothetical protein